MVSFIINIAFLVNFIGCSFASRLILLSFVKPVLYILHLSQHEARFTGYGLCPTSGVHSLSRRRDQSQPARFSIRRRYPGLTMACTEFANGPVGRYSVTSTIAQRLTLSRKQNSWIQKTPVTWPRYGKEEILNKNSATSSNFPLSRTRHNWLTPRHWIRRWISGMESRMHGSSESSPYER